MRALRALTFFFLGRRGPRVLPSAIERCKRNPYGTLTISTFSISPPELFFFPASRPRSRRRQRALVCRLGSARGCGALGGFWDPEDALGRPNSARRPPPTRVRGLGLSLPLRVLSWLDAPSVVIGLISAFSGISFPRIPFGFSTGRPSSGTLRSGAGAGCPGPPTGPRSPGPSPPPTWRGVRWPTWRPEHLWFQTKDLVAPLTVWWNHTHKSSVEPTPVGQDLSCNL